MAVPRRHFLLSLASPLYAAAPLKTLTPEQALLVEAICDQIIPADDTVGAKQAGVLYYIDQQLAGPLKRFRADYESGLALFAAECRRLNGKPFPALSSSQQTQFLRQIESRGPSPLLSFFQLVIQHTMQGFYGSPEHGGNRNEASWHMLGIADVMEGHRH